ncbi:MAG TPA: four helix bundle protein [Candidatus Omnitrophica bacterium]|nr:four helix bundle protein [Candidatus Omnitrophota bacterium]
MLNDFSLRVQLQKSAISVPSNIAERFERESKQEFIRFLYIAKGSCSELRTQVYIALKLEYISNDEFLILDDKCRKVSGMIMNLIKVLKPKNL